MTVTLPGPVLKPLPYAEQLARRDLAGVDLLVLHCTELPDLPTARRYGEVIHYENTGTGNSGHFYIDRDGHTEQWVPLERVAHHVRGFNDRSIGIELVNRGRYPDWYASSAQGRHEAYPEAQLTALLALMAALRKQLPALKRVAGHEDLDLEQVPASDDERVQVARKQDPGPGFPWALIEQRGGLQRLKAPPTRQNQ